jgi:toxin ParE1/3/4
MTVVVVSSVWGDLSDIVDRIAQDNPDAALRLIEAAHRLFDLIRDHPGIGRLRSFSQPGIRSRPITDFPNYLVFYLPTRTEIKILAVVHGARDVQTVVQDRL